MIGLSLIRERGRKGRNVIIQSFPLLASTANQRADCLLTSTKSLVKFKSSRAIRSTPDRVAVTAPKGRQHLTR